MDTPTRGPVHSAIDRVPRLRSDPFAARATDRLQRRVADPAVRRRSRSGPARRHRVAAAQPGPFRDHVRPSRSGALVADRRHAKHARRRARVRSRRTARRHAQGRRGSRQLRAGNESRPRTSPVVPIVAAPAARDPWRVDARRARRRKVAGRIPDIAELDRRERQHPRQRGVRATAAARADERAGCARTLSARRAPHSPSARTLRSGACAVRNDPSVPRWQRSCRPPAHHPDAVRARRALTALAGPFALPQGAPGRVLRPAHRDPQPGPLGAVAGVLSARRERDGTRGDADRARHRRAARFAPRRCREKRQGLGAARCAVPAAHRVGQPGGANPVLHLPHRRQTRA